MTEKRKNDHIDLTFTSRPSENILGSNLNYEPLFNAHPKELSKTNFLGFDFQIPLWISSMTGGAQRAKNINHNLARACGEFKIGMGLGSCRPLLESDERWVDFDIRKYMEDSPLYTNFGIAQLEQVLAQNKFDKVIEITKRLEANGIIIHINPLQEWAQPEGDRFKTAPIDTIKTICEKTDLPLIVKEVGQGMGPRSLEALSQLPVSAIELAAFGGTNFTKIEQARLSGNTSGKSSPSTYFGDIGHDPKQMINWLNILENKPDIIISGGITNPIYGHELRQIYQGKSIVGMASEVLKYAMDDYDTLAAYLNELKNCFGMAESFLELRGERWK